MHPARHRYVRNRFRKHCLELAIDDLFLKSDELLQCVATNHFPRWRTAAANLVNAHLHLVTLDERFACEDGRTRKERSWRRLDCLAASWNAEVRRSTFDIARLRYLTTHARPPVKHLHSSSTPTSRHPATTPATTAPRKSAPAASGQAQTQSIRAALRALDDISRRNKQMLEDLRAQRERSERAMEKMEQEMKGWHIHWTVTPTRTPQSIAHAPRAASPVSQITLSAACAPRRAGEEGLTVVHLSLKTAERMEADVEVSCRLSHPTRPRLLDSARRQT